MYDLFKAGFVLEYCNVRAGFNFLFSELNN